MKGCRCAAVLVLVLVAACASIPDRTLDTSRALASEGRWEDAISLLEAAAKDKDPSHPYRTALLDARAQAARSLLRDAEALAQSGRFDDARALYQRVLRIDPAELRASAGISSLQAAQRHAAWLDEAERAIRRNAIASAEPLVRQVLLESPRSARAAALLRQIEEQRPRAAAPALSASLRKPITLEFRDANLRMVFDVLSRASGINFVLDKDIRADARATIFIKNAPIEEALESLLVTNQLAKKTVGENSVLIYPNTPQKAREYQELVIRNFFLSNADAKQMMTLLRTILKTRDVYLDEKRNLLVIRDTPEAVLLAERLITAQEQAEPEVMLELEVIEVSRTRSSSLGVQFPEQVTFGVVNPITLQALRDLTRADVNLSTPAPPAGAGTAVQINLRRLFGDTNLLANPRIRVRNREKAKIHVGERVPII
ncbi:MAG: general secretion pathway protein GspD, partial [Burkholderiales bacterium]|nr:general secretion pathway protein GspD [Burkholderiales bacterium]